MAYLDSGYSNNIYPGTFTGATTATTTAWCSWIDTCTSATSTTATNAMYIWPQWCNTITSTTTSTNTIWINWNQLTADQQLLVAQHLAQQAQMQQNQAYQRGMQNAQLQAVQQPAPTEEELRAANEAAEARRAQAVEAEKKKQAIDAKAMEWLRENLSDKQRANLDKHGWFLVEGGKTKKTYKINTGNNRVAGNIQELNKAGKAIAQYCVHASYEFPPGDQWLAQALSLRLDEDHLIKTANRTALAA